MTVHERLRQYRTEHGIKQTHVAEKAGVSSKRISAIETGRIKLNVDEFEEICIRGYGISPAIFFEN